MEWIRKIIEENPKWGIFLERIEIIEGKAFSNPDFCVETSKSLIEAVCKSILTDKAIQIPVDVKVQALIKLTLENLPFISELDKRDKGSTSQIINALGNVSKSVGELRNSHGFISHGDDILKDKVDTLLSKLVIQSTDTVCGFLLQTHSEDAQIHKHSRIFYEDFNEFNVWYDEINEPVVCGNYIFKASITLFQNDLVAYRAELLEFKNSQLVDDE